MLFFFFFAGAGAVAVLAVGAGALRALQGALCLGGSLGWHSAWGNVRLWGGTRHGEPLTPQPYMPGEQSSRKPERCAEEGLEAACWSIQCRGRERLGALLQAPRGPAECLSSS